MGKRSDFDRKPRDFYPTPLRQVEALAPYLPKRFSYIEPCAGDGALIDNIAALFPQAVCESASDIEPMRCDIARADVFDLTFRPERQVDYIITNPPWDRKILHPMIEHLADIALTWLLIDANWVLTKQSERFYSRVRAFVPAGRPKWIPDSKFTAKDDAAWVLFDRPNDLLRPVIMPRLI